MEAESTSRDLLKRFAGISTVSDVPPPVTAAPAELSLGLSLGGCFSSNPREKTNFLIRSSSMSSFPNVESSIVKEREDHDNSAGLRAGTAVAAQLKRTCSMPVPGAEDYRKRKVLQTLKRLEAKRKRHEKKAIGGGGGGGLPPLSQGSGGSSSSSDRGSMQGFESTSKKLKRRVSVTDELEMPCVSTRGIGGLKGTRIEGFLYKYRKGEEVRIVCTCHGNFFTPAEFVRHAGGGDVEHPMRHIVVNTPPSPFL